MPHHYAPDDPLALGLGQQGGHGAGGEPRAHAVGTAGQHDGYLGTGDDAGGLGICHEDQLLRQHVAGLQVGNQQDVRLTGNRRDDALGAGSLFVAALSKAKRAVQYAPR